MIRAFQVRLNALLRRRAADDELDEELRYHLERETARNVAKGMSASDAAVAARRGFGNVTAVREQARESWQWPVLETLGQDVTFALRSFRRAPVFAVTVVATIGLALGLLSSAFTLVDAYVLRPMPVRDPHSLYDLSWSSANGRKHRFSWRQFQDLRAGSAGFSDAFAFEFVQAKLRGHPGLGQVVSSNYFTMVGVPAHLGRTLVSGDGDAAAPKVIVLSHHTWRTAFGADSSVIGTQLDVNGQTSTIVGVARQGFGGLTTAPFDFWIPLHPPAGAQHADYEAVRIVARVAGNLDRDGAYAAFRKWIGDETRDRPQMERAADVSLIARGTAFPKDAETAAIFGPVIIAFQLILLIACANVMNMMLARGLSRQREIGIRIALGAGRSRIVRQLITESMILAVVAGLVGFFVSRAAIGVSLSLMFTTVPTAYAGFLRVIPLTVDWTVVAFMAVSCFVTALVFGLAPALQATRPNLVQASRGDFDTPFRPMRLRNALVVAQISVSVLLLISAGVLLSAARSTRRIDPGIRVKNVLQVQLLDSLGPRAIDLLRARPDVLGIATSSATPLDGSFNDVSLIASGQSPLQVSYMVASPSYFRVLDLPMLSGRVFTDDEARSRAGVAIVGETTARQLWPGRNPIGEIISVAPTDRDAKYLSAYRSARVIGVTRDAVPGWIGRGRSTPTIYYPQPLDATAHRLLVLMDGDGSVTAPRIERSLAALHPSAVVEMHTLEEAIALQVYPFEALYWIASALGLIALGLTVTGVYGLLSYAVSQRQREFGVRMALGASRPAVIGLVMGESLRLSAIGIGVGCALALGVSRLFAGAIVNVRTFDVFGYAIGILLVLTTCLLAAYAPSARAARANPVDAIRAG